MSKRRSLEIVAELAGIRAESSSYDYNAHLASSRANKEQGQAQDKLQMANKWVAAQDKINNADIFDPNKHLKGMIQHNTLEAVYAYKDADNKLLGYVVRFVGKEDGKKQTLPVTYCYNAAKDEYSWRLKGFTDKGDKPIFGIEKAICSSKPILIVEGEKVAIAAAKILPDYAVVSWMGGSNAADKVNWSQLQWRDVIIWPDNDQLGFKAAEVIKDKINKANDHIGFVSVVDPTTLKFKDSIHKDLLPEKWDLADKTPEGMTIANVKEAIENVRASHLDLNQIQSVKYDSPMYQDILTSLAVSGERLSKSIKELNNSYNTQSYKQAQDTNSNNTPDIETIEAQTKIIVDTQNLYEKKALEYSGIAGTNTVYRDHLELMVKNYGESHGKVALYKNIVRDVSILHSAQLGMSINDLPDSHHKEIAQDVYSTA